MNRISTAGTYQSALLNIMMAQNRQSEAQRQVATGMKANDLKGFGYQAVTLTAAKSVKARVDSHLDNTQTLAATLNVQGEAMGQLADSVQSARNAVAQAVASNSAAGLMEAIQGSFSQMTSALNVRFQGRYLFSGGQHQTQPVAATTLADLTAAPTIASLFANDQLPTTDRIDDSTVISTGFLADQLGTPAFQALQAIQALDQGPSGPLNGTLTQAQATQLTSLLASFDSAFNSLTDSVAQNGAQQNRVDSQIKTLTDQQDTMKEMIAGVAEVDGAEAISRLQLSQVALQASAQVFATLNNSSLLNVLSQ